MKPPNLQPCSWLKEAPFKYLSGSTPQLVLYSFADTQMGDSPEHPLPAKQRPLFKNPCQWINLFHQTGGYACHHVFLYARFLRPTPQVQKLMEELSTEYYESCLAARYCPLKSLVKYEKKLNRFGLTANSTYKYLAEGFYPVDGTCLGHVTTERIPRDLQKLLSPAPRGHWLDWSPRHFDIAILTENCD